MNTVVDKNNVLAAVHKVQDCFSGVAKREMTRKEHLKIINQKDALIHASVTLCKEEFLLHIYNSTTEEMDASRSTSESPSGLAEQN